MPRVYPDQLSPRTGSSYPEPFARLAAARSRLALGHTGGLTDFGVNLTRLPPGTWSSQRHWHSHEEEFVYVLSGELVLVTDAGEEILRAGDCAAFPKNVPDGHQLINRSDTTAVLLEIGTRRDDVDVCTYPDIDLMADAQGYSHRDGTRYPG
ncbi:MAG: cupin domain-containing protein [Rhodanobacter sp.]